MQHLWPFEDMKHNIYIFFRCVNFYIASMKPKTTIFKFFTAFLFFSFKIR